VLFIPWVGIGLVCILASWYSIYVVGLDALLAPVIKLWIFLKPFLIHAWKFLLGFILWLWIHTIGKFGSWIGEMFIAVASYFGGWKAWSLKKSLRHAARFVVSFAARFLFINVLLNLLFGRERKGIRQVPALITSRIKQSRLAAVIHWWRGTTERQKRLIIGVVLCLVLVMAGYTFIGVSILLFDLLWELLLVLIRWLGNLWRFLLPILMRFVPNAIANFVTTKVVPVIANIAPVIKDDHRVLYFRFNLRRHYRNFKASLYKKSRSERSTVRSKVRPLVGERVRSSKANLIDAAASLQKDDHADKKD